MRILEYFFLQRNIRVLGTSCNSLTHPKWIQPSELVISSKSLSLCNNNKNRRKREMASKQRLKRCPGMRCLFFKFFFCCRFGVVSAEEDSSNNGFGVLMTVIWAGAARIRDFLFLFLRIFFWPSYSIYLFFPPLALSHFFFLCLFAQLLSPLSQCFRHLES